MREATIFTESERHNRVVAQLFSDGSYEIAADASYEDLFGALRQAIEALRSERASARLRESQLMEQLLKRACPQITINEAILEGRPQDLVGALRDLLKEVKA